MNDTILGQCAHQARRSSRGGLQAFLAAAYLSCIALAGCGGGDEPLSSAQAQAVAKVEVAQLHGILRPGADGVWYIQGSASNPDPDHAPVGIVSVAADQSDHLTINFDRRYTHAGAIQVTADDDFGGWDVRGYSNLGLTGANIQIYVHGVRIKPSEILRYVPAGAGNLWISASMVNKGF